MSSPVRHRLHRAMLVTAAAALATVAWHLGFDSASPQTRLRSNPLTAETKSASRSSGDTPAAPESGAVDGVPLGLEKESDPTAILSELGATPTGNRSSPFADVGPLEGSGGQGIHRAVRRAGVWFPLFAAGQEGAEADPEQTATADVPLYITSGSPPVVATNEPLAYTFEAIGGRPPYRWRMVLGVEGFQMDPNTGLLTGQSTTALALPLAIHVTDSAGAEDSALYTLRIGKAEPLTITTTALPQGTLGVAYQAQLEVAGGSPPYQWSTVDPLPAGFRLQAETGVLTVPPQDRGLDQELTFVVRDDAAAEATATLALSIDAPIQIVTPQHLPAAAPGQPISLTFEAAAGTPPYQWTLVDGTLPLSPTGQPWQLTPDGQLTGTAPLIDTLHHFTLEVRDSAGFSRQRQFQLPVRHTLVVIPSREKAGLAWQPREIARSLGGLLPRAYTVTRSLQPDGAAPRMVYQGVGSNFVDQPLPVGIPLFYTLHVHPADGGPPISFASTRVTVLPFTKARGQPGRTADPYADAVKLFQPLAAGGHGAAFLPGNVTGPPDGRGTFSPATDPQHILSLHARAAPLPLAASTRGPVLPMPSSASSSSGGSIVLAFEDNIVTLSPGEDLTVFENVFFIQGDPNQRFMEPATVSVALFEGEWHRLPIDVVPPASTSSTPPTRDPFYYNRGFAGRNATTGGDPTNPAASGGDSFDLDSALPLRQRGLTWIRYIKIQATGHNALRDDFGGHAVQHTDQFGALNGQGTSGFDLDAAVSLHP